MFANNSQYYGSNIFTSGVGFPLTAAQQNPPALAGTTLPISQAAVFDPHLRLPYTVQWNFTVEQRLGPAQVGDGFLRGRRRTPPAVGDLLFETRNPPSGISS